MRACIAEMSRALEGSDAALIEQFFYQLFTASEADEMAKRWALVKELANGTPQRRIAAQLGLSLCKITRGSKELKKPGSSFRQLLDKLPYATEPASTGPSRKPRANGTAKN